MDGSFSRVLGGDMSPVATEERRMLPLGGGLKRSASFVISVDEVEVIVIIIMESHLIIIAIVFLM